MFWIVTWWHFRSTSKEVICPPKNLNYMQGLRSAILAIFQKGLGWLSPVSAAPQKVIVAIVLLFVLGRYEYLKRLEGKIRDGIFFLFNILKNNSVN